MARPARGSWLSAALGLSVLAVLAFLVGAVAGLLWKEPGLVVAYLQGDTTEIAWSTASAEVVPAEAPPEEVPAAAPEAAVPDAPAKPKDVAAAPAAPRRPAPVAPVAAAPPGGQPGSGRGRIAVQVGAFAARDGAEALRSRLDAAGYPAYLAPGAQTGDHWRVRVGPYASRDEAARVAGRLEQAQKLPTWVLDEDAE